MSCKVKTGKKEAMAVMKKPKKLKKSTKTVNNCCDTSSSSSSSYSSSSSSSSPSSSSSSSFSSSTSESESSWILETSSSSSSESDYPNCFDYDSGPANNTRGKPKKNKATVSSLVPKRKKKKIQRRKFSSSYCPSSDCECSDDSYDCEPKKPGRKARV